MGNIFESAAPVTLLKVDVWDRGYKAAQEALGRGAPGLCHPPADPRLRFADHL